jgi:hypothetical protein
MLYPKSDDIYGKFTFRSCKSLLGIDTVVLLTLMWECLRKFISDADDDDVRR